MAEPEYTYTIELVVDGLPAPLRNQYDDEQACDTALNQLKAAGGDVDFGGWTVKAARVVCFRKRPVKKAAPPA